MEVPFLERDVIATIRVLPHRRHVRRCSQANEDHATNDLSGRTQALPQSPVPLSQHPRLRDAVHLNQMFSPSSEPGQSGWHILDPDGKRVMDPKKLMKDAREDEDPSVGWVLLPIKEAKRAHTCRHAWGSSGIPRVLVPPVRDKRGRGDLLLANGR